MVSNGYCIKINQKVCVLTKLYPLSILGHIKLLAYDEMNKRIIISVLADRLFVYLKCHTVSDLRNNCTGGQQYTKAFNQMKQSFSDMVREEADRIREEGFDRLREEMARDESWREEEVVSERREDECSVVEEEEKV